MYLLLVCSQIIPSLVVPPTRLMFISSNSSLSFSINPFFVVLEPISLPVKLVGFAAVGAVYVGWSGRRANHHSDEWPTTKTRWWQLYLARIYSHFSRFSLSSFANSSYRALSPSFVVRVLDSCESEMREIDYRNPVYSMLELSYSIGGFPLNGARLGLRDEEEKAGNFSSSSSSPSSSSSSLSSPSSISPPLSIPTPSAVPPLVRSTSHYDQSKSYTERMDELLLSSSLRRENTLDGRSDELVRSKRTSSISGARGAPFIVLPKEERFEILREKGRFAVDIGGTLVKLVYSSVSPPDADGSTDLLLNFRKFQSIDHCIEFLRGAWTDRNGECTLNGTGGGSFKYAELLQKELGVKVKRTDEMLSLITGCDFLLRNNEDESFTYHHEAEGLEKYQYKPIEEEAIYPFLLVNIGTGISVLKVDSPTSFTRVGGSTMGGGAFIGLGNLLTSARSFDELLLLAEKGDHRQVDSLVSDIYGGDYNHLGLAAEVIAGSFGKCSTLNHRMAQGLAENAKEEDVAKSLLLMISNTIGQMAFLYSNRFEMKRIYFGGFFIRKHPISMRTLSYAINYWSKGSCEALFLKHEGYLGAVGSFLDMNEDQKSSKHSE